MNLFTALLLTTPAGALPSLPAGDCFVTAFSQQRELPMLEQALVLEGRVRLERSGALAWSVEHPYRYGFTADAGRFTETLPSGVQRELDPRQAPWLAGMQQLFTALFAGDEDAFNDWFRLVDREQKHDGHRLHLKPTNAAVAQAVNELFVHYDDQLRRVRIVDADGGTTDIRFGALRPCSEGEQE